MLLLTRKQGESVLIGTDIEVTVLVARNGQVRLGIRAPAEVVIDRSEVAAKKAAAAAYAGRIRRPVMVGR